MVSRKSYKTFCLCVYLSEGATYLYSLNHFLLEFVNVLIVTSSSIFILLSSFMAIFDGSSTSSGTFLSPGGVS